VALVGSSSLPIAPERELELAAHGGGDGDGALKALVGVRVLVERQKLAAALEIEFARTETKKGDAAVEVSDSIL
jgi:hypothetical protein